ncbi:unnamed protein product [Boreogadus saida]
MESKKSEGKNQSNTVSIRWPPGALEPAWTPLPPGLLVGGASENRPEPGMILTDGLLVSEHLREPGPKWALDEAGPLSFRNRV